MKILVTGGAGYIGSHTIVELLKAGHDVIVVDNLSNSKEESLKRVREITGMDFSFYKADLCDKPALQDIFRDNSIDAVIHFAGLKAVGESVQKPLEYFSNNVHGTLCLCEVMRDNNVKKIVFSSSATVYGDPSKVPITEDFPLSARPCRSGSRRSFSRNRTWRKLSKLSRRPERSKAGCCSPSITRAMRPRPSTLRPSTKLSC